MGMIYAGIGSRETPKEVLKSMTNYAKELSATGWVLRSGGADGADTAFKDGVQGDLFEIFLAKSYIPDWAMETVDKYHPAPERLSPYARRLHARNAMIILGDKGTRPVDLIICWTKRGQVVGGTGQALRMAGDYKIPIINLGLIL
jgi:hypothetical protein